MPDERTYGFNHDDATALVQSIGNGESWLPEIKPRGGSARMSGKLDGELAVAGDFSDDPATATFSVWEKNGDGNMEDSGTNVTVVNRFLGVSLPAGTICAIEWIDSEWQVYKADCELT